MNNFQDELVKKPAIVYALLLIMLFPTDPCMSQSDIYLQNRYKPSRQKKINLNHTYTVQTTDSTYYKARLSVYSYDTLSVFSEYAEELTKIVIDEVIYLKKVKKSHVFEVIATVGMIGLTISPIIWATEGNEEALGMLEASGALLAISVPFIALKEIGRKKDTKKKWVISTV